MASAQARTLNAVFRRWFKPALTRSRSVESMRMVALRLERLGGAPPAGTRIRKEKLENFTAEWIHTSEPLPSRTILYIPGGGYVVRTPKVHRALAARIAREAEADALLAFYRLAPEHPFPAGLDDCVAAYEHLLEEEVEPSTIVIGGDSAGGGLTLSTLLAIRARGLPLPAAAFTLSAVTDLRIHVDGTRSSNEATDVMLSFDQSAEWHLRYVGGREELLDDPLVSPALGDFTGLPPLLMQASTAEVLLDDTRIVADRARAAGVDCTVQLFPGVFHVWHFVPHLPESKRALRHIAAFIRRHTEPNGRHR